MFMDRETQYCQEVHSSQPVLEIQYDPNENPNKLSYGYRQTDYEVYMEKQKAQNGQ